MAEETVHICKYCNKVFDAWRIAVYELGYAPFSMICKKCAKLFKGYPNLRWLEQEIYFKDYLDYMKHNFGIEFYLAQEKYMRKYFFKVSKELKFIDYHIK